MACKIYLTGRDINKSKVKNFVFLSITVYDVARAIPN